MNIADYAKYAYPFFIGLILWEYYNFKKRGWKFPLSEALISLFMGLSYHFTNHLPQQILSPLHDYIYQFRMFDLAENVWWSWALGFLVVEGAYYWLHRSAHTIRWLWASHCVHHSPVTMTFSGAYRLGVTGFFSGFFIFFLPVMILGFSPKMVLILFSFNLVYQFFLHTTLIPKLGLLEHIFNTPSHHRVHHATNPEYRDKNYGGVLIIFDRIFGTLAIEDETREIYFGLVGKEPSLNPFKLFFQEWLAIRSDLRQARSLREAFLFAFSHPSWQPESWLDEDYQIELYCPELRDYLAFMKERADFDKKINLP